MCLTRREKTCRCALECARHALINISFCNGAIALVVPASRSRSSVRPSNVWMNHRDRSAIETLKTRPTSDRTVNRDLDLDEESLCKPLWLFTLSVLNCLSLRNLSNVTNLIQMSGRRDRRSSEWNICNLNVFFIVCLQPVDHGKCVHGVYAYFVSQHACEKCVKCGSTAASHTGHNHFANVFYNV